MLMPLFVLYIFMSIQTWLGDGALKAIKQYSLKSNWREPCCRSVVALLLLLLLLWFLLLFLFVVLLLQLLLPLHVMLVVFVLFFFRTTLTFPPSTFSFASGRSPQTSSICNGAYVATDVSTEQE